MEQFAQAAVRDPHARCLVEPNAGHSDPDEIRDESEEQQRAGIATGRSEHPEACWD
jgi:hypothetical protein